MNRGFLDSGGWKSNHRKKTDTVTGIGLTLELVETSIDATSLVDSVEKEVLSPSVVNETVAKEKQCSLVNTTDLRSFPPLPSQETLLAGNAPGKSLYANVTGKPSGKKVNFCTLFTPEGNGIDWLSCYSDGLNAMIENGPWFIRNNPFILKKWHPDVNTLKEDVGTPLMHDSYTSDMCMQSWGRSSYARAMIELRVDVELKDSIVAAMPKIIKEGYNTCNIRVEYEWKLPRCICCKVFGHVLEECPKNIGVGVTKKKTSQTPKGILVGQKMGFKPMKQHVYQPVSKKSTASNGGNMNKNVEPINEVSKSNSFEALNSVDNDVELSTNGGSTHLASQEANSSGSTFWNAESSSPSTTPIIEKINKMENLIIDGKAILMDNEGKSLSKVDEDSEDEVVLVDNEMASFLAKEDGYGIQSLLEQ
ncbi:hypothetical protein Tco_0740758 [Tanacetum coccineum]